jgi:lipopolysaccharide/colanic/teichoic acid biosynthesis glycosyltransferase
MAKRTFDLAAASAIGLLLITPVLALSALAIRLDSDGPVLFRQERMGLHRQRFQVLKFRTMVVGAEYMVADLKALNKADGPLFKMRDDPQVTGSAASCAATALTSCRSSGTSSRAR